MSFPRSSGIILHPTSLPSRFGIGDLGESAYQFVDFLVATRQRLWQVLPLGPTGYGDSPYQTFSSFGGNPLLIDLEELVKEGALPRAGLRPCVYRTQSVRRDALQTVPAFPDDRVDFGEVIGFKTAVLRQSFEHFYQHASRAQQQAFVRFCDAEQRWLDDFALFMALKAHHDGAVWNTWEPDIAAREPEALAKWRQVLAEEIAFQRYLQYQFFRQWSAVKHYANRYGIQIVGDIPIFLAHDSADVWANPNLFYLDESGEPTVVAGVPPDYFSETGQLWGNPLYRWDVIEEDGFSWWIERLRAILRMVDIVRLDHFRGFEGYWEIPAEEDTAIRGRWVKGPGEAFFHAVQEALGEAPIIAEDLGVITPDVEALRDGFGYPGMRVLQFAFSTDAGNEYLPHNYIRNCVVYSGTHDNDTTVGWFRARSEEERAWCLTYLGTDGQEIHWDFIRLGLMSVADTFIFPLQDLLGLGTEARMNYPGRLGGNWTWRYTANMLTDEIRQRLTELTEAYSREPGAPQPHLPEF